MYNTRIPPLQNHPEKKLLTKMGSADKQWALESTADGWFIDNRGGEIGEVGVRNRSEKKRDPDEARRTRQKASSNTGNGLAWAPGMKWCYVCGLMKMGLSRIGRREKHERSYFRVVSAKWETLQAGRWYKFAARRLKAPVSMRMSRNGDWITAGAIQFSQFRLMQTLRARLDS